MANMTATEQLLLELVNRARMDPLGEARRMGIGLNEGLKGAPISSTPKQVLAGNDRLNASADAHSSWMLSTDTFSHTGVNRSTPTDRMKSAGYVFTGTWTNGENISLVGNKGALDLTDSIFEQHKNLFLSTSGHRQNLMGDSYREVGLGQQVGDYKGFTTSMVTQNFAKTGDAVFVTGVVYDDTVVNDDFFTVGEQKANVAVTGTGSLKDTTGAGGGYELGFVGAGAKTVSFATSAGAVTVALMLGTNNVKIDLVNGKEIWTNVTVTSTSTLITELRALGITQLDLKGSAASEGIYGNAAGNGLIGNGGNDRLFGNGGNDVLAGGAGIDTMEGGAANDRFVFQVASDSGVDRARDTVSDFDDFGDDTLDFSAFAPPFTYRGTAAITGANQINVVASGSDVIVNANLDADLTIELQVLLKGTLLKDMTPSDFIL